MQSTKKRRPRFRYIGPDSAVINALPNDTEFRKQDGYYVSTLEELFIKSTPEMDSNFQLIEVIKSYNDEQPSKDTKVSEEPD